MSFWAFAVLIVSVIVDFLRARTLRKVAEHHASSALASDAEHFANEAIVHVEPAATPDEPRATSIRAIADRLGLRVHNLNIFLVGRETRVELDLELPDSLTLAEAHRHSETLEAAIVRELPGTVRVTVHLEPRSDEPKPAVRHVPSTRRVEEALSQLPEAGNVRVQDVVVTDEGLVVTSRKPSPA